MIDVSVPDEVRDIGDSLPRDELRLEAGLRHARTTRIPRGAGGIRRRTVARRLLAGHMGSRP